VGWTKPAVDMRPLAGETSWSQEGISSFIKYPVALEKKRQREVLKFLLKGSL
jgi:hypothetical protein